MAAKKGNLTKKQKMFVAEYLVDLNATQAAIRAGYSEKNAGKIGPELLGKTRISEAIQEQMDARENRTLITADKVLEELAKIGFSNLADYIQVRRDGTAYVDLSELTREQAAAVQEITVLSVCQREFKALWDSIYAKKGYGWDANPWVWVIDFKRCSNE